MLRGTEELGKSFTKALSRSSPSKEGSCKNLLYRVELEKGLGKRD